MLGSEFLVLAVALRIAAGLGYLLATFKGTARPNPVTWFFWGLAPLLAFFAQVGGTIRPEAWVTLVMAVGPLAIFAASLSKGNRHWKVGAFDYLCGVSAAVGIVLWQATDNPLNALAFGILADILGGIPTLQKAYAAPYTERAYPYFLSMVSMVITLLTVRDWYVLNFGFPFYMFCINLTLFTLIASRVGLYRKPTRQKRA